MDSNRSVSKFSQRFQAAFLTLGIAGWFQEIFSIEWSSAHCSNATDGPVSAVWGMPLPYIRWSTVFSMEYFWMPTVFILNLALLFAAIYPLVAWLVSVARTSVRALEMDRAGDEHLQSGFARRTLIVHALDPGLTFVGALLVILFCTWIGLQIYTGIYKIPVSNIANENYESYTDLRPVGFGFKSLRYDCTPIR
jgi:hypothetical protein